MNPLRIAVLVCVLPAAPVYSQAARLVVIFQNNFWLNLHHFLHGECVRPIVGVAVELPFSALTAEERGPWERALNAYKDLARRDLLFDESMVAIDNALAESSGSSPIQSSAVKPEILDALNGAAPVYRAHRWEKDLEENDRWIAVNRPLILQHADAVKAGIAAAFQVDPPKAPILVDLARDIGLALAYTTNGPPGTAGHTVVAPQKNMDPDVALNTIYHEISHTMDERIMPLVDKEASRQGVSIPPDLWHALTLYTTGMIARRELRPPEDRRPYGPDADRVTMFERNGWREILAVLEKYWQPHLDGMVSLEKALSDVVRNAAR
jgi:hypothetical protein